MKKPALVIIILLASLYVMGCAFTSPARFIARTAETAVADSPPQAATQTPVVITVEVTRLMEAATPAAASATPDSAPIARPTSEEPAVSGSLRPEERLLISLYERVSPSVVHIRVATKVDESQLQPFLDPNNPRLPDEFFRRGQGSGFVWDTDGHIVTNQHVVSDATTVEVGFLDGTRLTAQVVAGDAQSDIAVIKVDPATVVLRPVDLGDSDAVQVGQWGIAIGNPFGQTWTMTSGIISAVGRTMQGGLTRFSIAELIQTDAAINPGNSGGPLLDSSGRVVGMNTLILSESGASAGVGFAVPSNTIKTVVPDLISSGRHTYAWLGITGRDLLAEDISEMGLDVLRGAIIIEVTEGGPAERAGLQAGTRAIRVEGVELTTGGDVIIAIEGAQVGGMDDLISYLVRDARPGQRVTLTVIRDGQETLVPVVLGERPNE